MSAFSARTNACLLVNNVDNAFKRQMALREGKKSFKKVDAPRRHFQAPQLRGQISKIKMVKEKKKKGRKEEGSKEGGKGI